MSDELGRTANSISRLAREKEIEELERLRQIAVLVWPFVRHWPMAGVGAEGMQAFVLLAEHMGEDTAAVNVEAGAEAGAEAIIDQLCDYLTDSNMIKWVDPRSGRREQFLEMIRNRTFLGENDAPS